MRHLGAYGFRLVPEQPYVELPDLVPVQGDAPPVRVAWHGGKVEHEHLEVDETRVEISVPDWINLRVVREPADVVGTVPRAPTPGAVVHPLLTLPLALLAHWRGCITLHGGAFLAAERAWVVLGEREAGKSTLLATLATKGTPVIADDLVVVLDGEVLAGPRCVDLRPDTVARFPAARSIGVVAGRHRFRLTTPPGPERVRLGGFIVLEWMDTGEPRIERLAVPEQLAAIHAGHYAQVLGPPEPEQALALLDAPIWRVRRDRGWAGARAALEAVLALATPQS